MKFLCLALGVTLAVYTARAEDLGGRAEINAGDTWKNVPLDPSDPPAIFPTLKYVPKDGRNAAVFVTLFTPAVAQVEDLTSLKAFLLRAAGPMLPSADSVPQIMTPPTADGTGIYAVFVDPSLVGRPSEPGNFKVATPTEVLLKNGYTVQGTVFTDEPDSPTWKEGLSIILGARGRGVAAVAASDSFTVPLADATLRFPPGRFRIQDGGPAAHANYFSRIDRNGVVLSGWLNPAAQFGGMPAFWDRERAALVSHGFSLSGEKAEDLGTWSAVRYTITLPGGMIQRNIRACRVVGGTWADLHTSVTGKDSSWEQLETLIRQVGLVANPP